MLHSMCQSMEVPVRTLISSALLDRRPRVHVRPAKAGKRGLASLRKGHELRRKTEIQCRKLNFRTGKVKSSAGRRLPARKKQNPALEIEFLYRKSEIQRGRLNSRNGNVKSSAGRRLPARKKQNPALEIEFLYRKSEIQRCMLACGTG